MSEIVKLSRLLKSISEYDLQGDPGLEIGGISYDSRLVNQGDLFVALKGYRQDGHSYLLDAVEKGAAAVVTEGLKDVPGDVTRIRVSDSRETLSKLAAEFYDHPAEGINMIGITGTNGKTTTSYLLESILHAAGARPGVIGTINYRFPGKTAPAPVTTPESLDLMRMLREMADAGVTDVIMEVSSHALAQNRTRECPFKVAVFTNFSRDHLDYHQTMEAYFQAKSLLFRGLGRAGKGDRCVAVINMDDPRGRELADLTGVRIVTYGLGGDCLVRADSVSAEKDGLRARLVTPAGAISIRSTLIGKINLYNILAASAAALSMDVDLDGLKRGIEQLRGVPGRLELVPNPGGLSVVVDYAHTPDALLKALTILRSLVRGRLITVFGCGGDRDKGKRYEMGLIGGKHSDLAIITSDNPRNEDPEAIIAQIEKGTKESGMPGRAGLEAARAAGSGYVIEADRRKAIRMAIAAAKEEDMILIAGKGHENYQIIGNEKRHFDDREEVIRAATQCTVS